MKRRRRVLCGMIRLWCVGIMCLGLKLGLCGNGGVDEGGRSGEVRSHPTLALRCIAMVLVLIMLLVTRERLHNRLRPIALGMA